MNYLDKIGSLMPVFVSMIIVIRIIRQRELNRKNLHSPAQREILMGIYLIFIFALYSQTVLSDLETFMWEGWLNINLDPFRFIEHTMSASRTYFLVNVLGNIAFFIPIGLLTPILFKGNSLIVSVGTGFMYSLSIELLQIPILRATDVDDLILNTTGAVIGYIIYIIAARYFPKIKSEFKIKRQ